MAKWADYIISGVWFMNIPEAGISHVMLHIDYGTSFGFGVKYNTKDVVDLLKKGLSVKTIVWNYAAACWDEGDLVSYEKTPAGYLLCTKGDKKSPGRLENQINFALYPI